MPMSMSALKEEPLFLEMFGPRTAAVRTSAIDTRPKILCALLSPGEQTILKGLLGEKRKRAFVAGRVAAKHCIALLLSEDVLLSEIDIARKEGGAPALSVRGVPQRDIFLSISHGGNFAFAGADTKNKIGLDVEPVSRKCVRLKDAFATEKETQVLKNAAEDDADLAAGFTRLFSAKESAAKCLGTHMYFAFHHYRLVSVDKDSLVLDDESEGRARFRVETRIKDKHVFSRLLCPVAH
jgi:4'-phosphopantetheinyl transferase EntD